MIPVGPLTDDDKGELQTIQNMFGSQVNDFTMILFTIESDPTAEAVLNFVERDKDIDQLRQRCGGGYVVLNTTDKQHIPKLLDKVDLITLKNISQCYTWHTFSHAQIEKIIWQEKIITSQKAELMLKNNAVVTCKYYTFFRFLFELISLSYRIIILLCCRW